MIRGYVYQVLDEGIRHGRMICWKEDGFRVGSKRIKGMRYK